MGARVEAPAELYDQEQVASRGEAQHIARYLAAVRSGEES
jgi:hypothetical protein